jgi:hypothetical protein
MRMLFSSLITGWRRGAITVAAAVFAAALCAPSGSLAHEQKATAKASARSSDAALVSNQRLGIPLKEIKRGNAYARVVWMPEGASVRLGGSDVSFGLARLNPLVRRNFGLSSSEVGAIAAPVMSMQVSPTSSVTFIKVLGDSNGAMVAWQLKL